MSNRCDLASIGGSMLEPRDENGANRPNSSVRLPFQCPLHSFVSHGSRCRLLRSVPLLLQIFRVEFPSTDLLNFISSVELENSIQTFKYDMYDVLRPVSIERLGEPIVCLTSERDTRSNRRTMPSRKSRLKKRKEPMT